MKVLCLFLFSLTVSLLAERPNFIFLFADDQRPDTIGAFGNDQIKTPNLDKLINSGFSFRNNYCAGSYSGAVCVASRSMLMTGRHWPRIQDRKNWRGLPLLPELLGRHEYQTFATGKWHNGETTLARAFQSGKNIFMGGMCDHTKVPLQNLRLDGTLTEKTVSTRFSSETFADTAIEFLQSDRDPNQPFFLYVAFTAPHDPRNPPEAYRETYYQQRPPLPPNFLPQHPFDNGHIRNGGRDESLADWPRQPAVIGDQLCEYYGLITHLDEQVGRIVTALNKTKYQDNTYIIYTADHGLAMGSHGLLGKQNIYEHSMGSPLIISGPGVPRNQSTYALTYLLDLFPTICELSKSVQPTDVGGHDLSPLWTGKKKAVRDSVFLAFQQSMRAVRTERWKLHIYPEINHTLLYDLQQDPHEIINLATNPEQQDRVRELTSLMKKWQRQVGDDQALFSKSPRSKPFDPTKVKRRLDVWQPKWIRDKYFQGRNNPDHGN